MTKDDLLFFLTGPRIPYVYGLAMHRVLAKFPDKLVEYLSGGPMVFRSNDGTEAHVPLPPLRDLYLGPNGPAGFLGSLGHTLGRSLVRDTYELIVAYCGGKNTDAFNSVKDHPVMMFAWVVRNTFAHREGVTIQANKLDAPVSWRAFTITPEDAREGRALRRFEPDEYYRLHEDLMLLAKEALPDQGEDLRGFSRDPSA